MWTDPWVGLPYAVGGRGPAFDCFGLVQALYRDRHGIDLTGPEARLADHRAALAAATGWHAVNAADVCEGDALVFRGEMPGAMHVAYALGSADMLHTSPGQGSRVEKWKRAAWTVRLIGCWRSDAV